MAYFPLKLTLKPSLLSRSLSWFNDGSPTFLPYPDYPELMEHRSGTNTPGFRDLPDNIKSSPYIVRRRRKVGTEVRERRVKEWYTDPGGRSKYRYKTVSYTANVYLMVPEVRYKSIKRPKFSEHLLAPNALLYSKVSNVSSPTFWEYTVTRQSPSSEGSPPSATFSGLGLVPAVEYNTPQWGVGTGICQPITAFISPSGALVDELSEKALSKLYKRVQDEFPDYMTALAEAPKTFQLVNDIVKGAVNLLRALKKLDVQAVRKGFKGVAPADLASVWLSYIYGVAPVISDINATIDLINRKSRTWRSYSSSEQSSSFIETEFPNFGLLGVEAVKRVTSVRYGVIMTGDIVIDRIIDRNKSKWALVGTAYELLPFSFMLDWIVDVSSFLKSRNVLDSHVLHMWKTTYVSYEAVQTMDFNGTVGANLPGDGWTNYVFSGAKLTNTQKAVTVRRDIINSPPPMPAPQVLPIRDALSTLRSVNALSIWLASFKR